MLFSQSQLGFIKRAALAAEAQGGGELLVAALAAGQLQPETADEALSDELIGIVRFASGECQRQGSGALSVYWMVTAHDYAVASHERSGGVILEADVIEMLRLIEPEVNANGYRRVPVRINNTAKVIGFQHIDQRMRRLIEFQDALDPIEFYTELEEIHPAKDGNGRLGAILFNWKRGTLRTPGLPPEVEFS